MNGRSPAAGALLDAVRWLGLLPSYIDHTGVRRDASPTSLLAVGAAAAGLRGATEDELVAWVGEQRSALDQRLVEPVVVLWQPGPAVVALRRRGNAPLTVEITIDPFAPDRGGEHHAVASVTAGDVDLAPLALPIGRHRLRVSGPEVPVDGGEATVIVAPRRVAPIADVVGSGRSGGGRRPWGVFAPVWSAWSPTRPEVHLGSLDAVGSWAAHAGASLVGTLPLLATFASGSGAPGSGDAGPCDPSPYSPVSRRRWNEGLIDLRNAPGFDDCADARALAGSVVPSDPAAAWDPLAHWAAVVPVLDVLAEHARLDDALAGPVVAALATDPELAAYARFRAEVERTRTPWSSWPTGTSLVTDVRADAQVWRWAWSQWLVARQLGELAEAFASRRQSLYLDLALGAHADGFDTWADPALFGWGASVGAPPDAMFGGGQDWGFPPQRPDEARRRGHDEWASALRAHFAVARILRLDHVLGLQRLYWVPADASPADGVYVRQPLEELLAVLAVEAHRAGAAAVGEDLGTVDPEVREAMARHGVAGMHIAQFAVSGTAAPGGSATGGPVTGGPVTGEVTWPTAGQLSSVNTHDMPTFVGWMAAVDADHRRNAGLIDDAGVRDVRRQRAVEVATLRAALGVVPPVSDVDAVAGGDPTAGWEALLAALLARLGASSADAVLVAVDDLAGVSEQQNVPGTPWWRPNWVVRLPVPLEVLAAETRVVDALVGLDRARRAPTGGAGG